MVHSFSKKSSRIVFHPQLLSDFAMVEDIGRKMLVELAREVPAQRVSRPSHFNASMAMPAIRVRRAVGE
jgi:hypothetical protein